MYFVFPARFLVCQINSGIIFSIIRIIFQFFPPFHWSVFLLVGQNTWLSYHKVEEMWFCSWFGAGVQFIVSWFHGRDITREGLSGGKLLNSWYSWSRGQKSPEEKGQDIRHRSQRHTFMIHPGTPGSVLH